MVGVKGLLVGKHDLGANQGSLTVSVMHCFFELEEKREERSMTTHE